MTGEGEMLWPNGSVYKGGMRKNLMQGHGTLTWPDGSYYFGEWANGKQEGDGMIRDPNGDASHGYWVGGQLPLDDLGMVPMRVPPLPTMHDAVPDFGSSSIWDTCPRPQLSCSATKAPSIKSRLSGFADCE